jgi:hypothetical protein
MVIPSKGQLVLKKIELTDHIVIQREFCSLLIFDK